MDYNSTLGMDGDDELNTFENISESAHVNIRIQAMSYMMYKIGEAINKVYFPAIIPVGVVGNILSFLVMVQGHNRRMPFSLYISVLSVTDTIALLVNFASYLRQVHKVALPPNPTWNCRIGIMVYFTSSLCSTFFVISMTFDRFYSIIRPHKAASFNTMKRAKVTILCIILFSVLFHIPHLFINSVFGNQCVTFFGVMGTMYGQLYYWITYVMSYVLPFILLIIMNGVIIHYLRQRLKWSKTVKGQCHEKSHRSQSQGQCQGQVQGEGQRDRTKSKDKPSERHVYVTLLLVSFTFLILTTPACFFTFYVMFVDYTKTPLRMAGYYLYYHFGQKSLVTNNAINFFLYVTSGQKFRRDLVRLFSRQKSYLSREMSQSGTRITTVTTRGQSTNG